MSYQSRRILTPGPSRKRKEREDQPFYYSSLKPSSAPAPAPARAGSGAEAKPASPAKAGEPVSSNRLLAGYMAHEFLTKGTLFGQKFDPARAEAVPVGGLLAEPKRAKPEVGGGGAEPSAKKEKEHESYAEVASILKTDGAHIPGIVNPTQLARWIQM